MNKYVAENKRRIAITLVASIIFILAASAAVICGITTIYLSQLKSSAESSMQYGYDTYYIHGEKVSANEFFTSLDDYYYSLNSTSENYDMGSGHAVAITDEDMDGNSTIELYGEGQSENPYIIDEVEDGFSIKHIDPDFSFNEELFNKYMGGLWLTVIVSGVLMLITGILIIVYCGTKNENGIIELNLFDRIFPELQIAFGILVAGGLLGVYFLLDSWFVSSERIRAIVSDFFYDYHDLENLLSWYSLDQRYGSFFSNLLQPSWVVMLLIVVASIIIFSILVMLFISIIKKFKAHFFLRSTILGRIIYGVGDVAERSTHTKRKLYLGVIGFTFTVALLAFLGALSLLGGSPWILLFIAIGLVILFLVFKGIDKGTNQYEMVKAGLDEVQKGNFSYKIPDIGPGEFGELARSVNSITDAQSEAIKNELKSQRLRSELISNVSHDLRTPLTSMISYVDLLKSEGLDSPNAEEYLNIISEKTERLHKLTDDLFEAAKASSGDIPVNIEKIDLDAMASQAIAELEENLSANNIEIVYSCKVENPEVMADGNLLWRVIENMMTNVSKYALSGTRAYVDIIEKNDRIAIEVKNMSRDGLNISTDELMERFQRGDDSRNTDGSGLGLAIANDLTSLMDGEFHIHIDGDLFKATVELKKA